MVDGQAPRAPSTVPTGTDGKICEWCKREIPTEGRKRISYRRFCSDQHRNAFHKAERDRWEAEAKAALEILGDRIGKLAKKGRRR